MIPRLGITSNLKIIMLQSSKKEPHHQKTTRFRSAWVKSSSTRKLRYHNVGILISALRSVSGMEIWILGKSIETR